jgi:hypothetical protein
MFRTPGGARGVGTTRPPGALAAARGIPGPCGPLGALAAARVIGAARTLGVA